MQIEFVPWDRQAANPPLCLAPGLRQASIQTVIVYITGVNDYTLGAIFERALLREIIKIKPEAYARRAF
ncbi:hypothetical protein DSM104635_01616 [Terricaulis silvestris]|uniref:Uncharacterized protein n=1 Tax=Terricaulis silvestris TaxID=2686094 RepID=A0A6I6MI98_9CAUL|nr:hypothetical protein DSM104635_01616 [Terricaulis silvestris]